MLLFILLPVVFVSAQQDCHFTLSSLKFDLSSLSTDTSVNRTRDTPPTKTLDSFAFNVCNVLDIGCGDHSRACLTKINQKEDEPDRVVAVVPLATTDPEYSPASPKGISLLFHGPSYPRIDGQLVDQSINITVLCATELGEPRLDSYDGARATVTWDAPAGCPFKADDEPPAEDDEEQHKAVGSGVGWFFLALILAFFAYFVLGAYYNYSTYGASGTDLIPHRDFWKEVPYMLSDLFSHLCSTFRSRRPSSSRSGYIAV